MKKYISIFIGLLVFISACTLIAQPTNTVPALPTPTTDAQQVVMNSATFYVALVTFILMAVWHGIGYFYSGIVSAGGTKNIRQKWLYGPNAPAVSPPQPPVIASQSAPA